MKEGDVIYCIDESVYSTHISKRKEYSVFATKENQVRIKNNNGKFVWISDSCFSESKPSNIVSINIDDEIEDKNNDLIKVTIIFENKKKCYATFITFDCAKKLAKNNSGFLLGDKFIFVEAINESVIKQIITELDKQNKLDIATIEFQ
ncbi:MAG: hypothetical protein ACI85I_000317 [Arenicella sp.]|jgi:hypothetical protein